MGHVPRTRGSTGTMREQEFTRFLGEALADRLRARGWDVYLIGADPSQRRYPATDLFLALHCDGSSNTKAGGASFFYPKRCEVDGEAWGVHWAAAHQKIADYNFGFRRPNYVAKVSTGFYAWRASRVRTGIATPARVCLLCEHYFATNPAEAEWAWDPGRIEKMADAHVTALTKWNGQPRQTGSLTTQAASTPSPKPSSPKPGAAKPKTPNRSSPSNPIEGPDDMYLAVDTTEDTHWLVAGQRARLITDVDAFNFDGPTRTSPNMRFVIADLFDVVGQPKPE